MREARAKQQQLQELQLQRAAIEAEEKEKFDEEAYMKVLLTIQRRWRVYFLFKKILKERYGRR